MDRIIIWGAGGHAKVVAASIRRMKRFHVAGFIDDVNPGRAGEMFAGAPILGDRTALRGLLSSGIGMMHLAFGNCAGRQRLGEDMAALGFAFPTLVDPSALVVDGASIGPGTFIGPSAIVNADAQVGTHVIINTAAIVEHDCVIGNAAHLAPRASMAGHAHIGELTFVGLGAMIRDKVHVGRSCVIGMGSVVTKDIPDRARAFGSPATIKEAK